VWPVAVVIAAVGAEYLLEVAAAEDEHAVETLGPDGAHPPLGDRVRVRSCGSAAPRPRAVRLDPHQLISSSRPATHRRAW
jgi:hypothetical protein